jgi:hypothetical protein
VDSPEPEYSFGQMVLAFVVFPLAVLCLPIVIAAAGKLFQGVR